MKAFTGLLLLGSVAGLLSVLIVAALSPLPVWLMGLGAFSLGVLVGLFCGIGSN